MRKNLICLCIGLLGLVVSFAQSKTISGKITDAKDNSPLAGVTVTSKGSKAYALTSSDGSFSIKVNANAKTLHISYIGYDEKDVAFAAGVSSITVSLGSSSRALNEVVVVGYGKANKKDLTGSISKLASKDIENFPAPSFESAIQGKAPGVVVTSGSGKL